MNALPKILQLEEQLSATIHLTVPRSEIQSVMEPAIHEILAVLAAQGTHPAGALFSYHLSRPCEVFDFEVGFPVSQIITPQGRVKASKLPASKVVQTIYRGDYQGLGAAWGEFFDWIQTEQLCPQNCLWERYLVGPESSADPAAWVTELNAPLIA